jgi:hypothetical protein
MDIFTFDVGRIVNPRRLAIGLPDVARTARRVANLAANPPQNAILPHILLLGICENTPGIQQDAVIAFQTAITTLPKKSPAARHRNASAA